MRWGRSRWVGKNPREDSPRCSVSVSTNSPDVHCIMCKQETGWLEMREKPEGWGKPRV